MKREKLLNTTFNNLTMEAVLDWVWPVAKKRTSDCIVELNVDVVMKIEHDEELRNMVRDSGLSLIDGQVLLKISRLKGVPAKEKISGSDLVPKICSMAVEKDCSLFLLGGQESVAKLAVENLRKLHKGIRVDSYSPPLGFENDPAELERINEMLNRISPDIVILCLGCPKQEKWWYRNREKLNVGLCICAGATVDFIAGTVKRAPSWISNLGFEWFYRFLQEPRRLFRRYFIDDVKVFGLILKYGR